MYLYEYYGYMSYRVNSSTNEYIHVWCIRTRSRACMENGVTVQNISYIRYKIIRVGRCIIISSAVKSRPENDVLLFRNEFD